MEFTDPSGIRVIAMDLDGTLSQHKCPVEESNLRCLGELGKKYRLLMVGAGQAERIFDQMGGAVPEIIGNYGMQYAVKDPEKNELVTVRDDFVDCDRESVAERAEELRKRFGFTEYAGDPVQFHPSGCVTIPLLGTAAVLKDKLAFDPDRKKRRAIYGKVCRIFGDFNVFVGGSSFFDMAPMPYNKYHALDRWCRENAVGHSEVVFLGDDYGPGGNDESVYLSDFPFITVDDYRLFPERVAPLLEAAGLTL